MNQQSKHFIVYIIIFLLTNSSLLVSKSNYIIFRYISTSGGRNDFFYEQELETDVISCTIVCDLIRLLKIENDQYPIKNQIV